MNPGDDDTVPIGPTVLPFRPVLGAPPLDDDETLSDDEIGEDAANAELIKNESRREKAQLLKLIQAQVQYPLFIKLEPRMKLDEFNKVRTIALVDTFLEMTNRAISDNLGIARSVILRCRDHVHFPALQQALLDAAMALAAKTIDEMAKVMEGSVAREMATSALSGGTSREQLVALQEFSSRLAPKPGRQGERQGVLFPPELLEIIARGVQMMPPPADGQVIEISASRVNVPQLEEHVDE